MSGRRRTCCVDGCRDTLSKRHRFPKNDPDLFSVWIQKVNHFRFKTLSPDDIYKGYFICTRHFEQEFILSGTRRGLRRDAIPTLHMNNGPINTEGIVNQIPVKMEHSYCKAPKVKIDANDGAIIAATGTDPVPRNVTNEYLTACRTCLGVGLEMVSVFNPVNILNQTVLISDLFKQYCQIEMDNSEPPPLPVCTTCVEKLRQAAEFFENCRRNQMKFRKSIPVVNENSDENSDNNKAPSDIETNRTPSPTLEYPCDLCSRTFKNKYSRNRHQKIHGKTELSKCEVCLKQFSRLADVKRHQVVHTGEKPYACDLCDAVFNQSGSLTNHVKRVHGKFSTKNPQGAKEKNAHLCWMCGQTFTQSFSLKVHIRRHLGEEPCVCDVCNKGFVSTSRLTAHVRLHTGERCHVCNVCGKKFSQTTNLTKHLRAHRRTYSCDVCFKTFTTQYYYKIHQRVHSGEKVLGEVRPYLCIICGMSFKWSLDLRTHMKTHQSNSNGKKAKSQLILLVTSPQLNV